MLDNLNVARLVVEILAGGFLCWFFLVFLWFMLVRKINRV